MYVTAYITIADVDYEVGAEVEYTNAGGGSGEHEVGEPDVSAPGCRLKEAWLVDQDGELPSGWSDEAKDALVDVYEGRMADAADDLSDFRSDAARNEDPDGDFYWSEGGDY